MCPAGVRARLPFRQSLKQWVGRTRAEGQRNNNIPVMDRLKRRHGPKRAWWGRSFDLQYGGDRLGRCRRHLLFAAGGDAGGRGWGVEASQHKVVDDATRRRPGQRQSSNEIDCWRMRPTVGEEDRDGLTGRRVRADLPHFVRWSAPRRVELWWNSTPSSRVPGRAAWRCGWRRPDLTSGTLPGLRDRRRRGQTSRRRAQLPSRAGRR